MKKNKTKRLLSLLLTLCMVVTMMPMTAFAENAKADSVTINGVTLSAMYPYLVSGASSASGTFDGTSCTAYLDASTGILSLWNYNGGGDITAGGTGGARDLTVELKGTNTITGMLNNGTDGGNLVITADATASLSINNSGSSAGPMTGIATYLGGNVSGGGSMSITGKANITINVTNTGTNAFSRSYGLNAKQGISISDSASLNITSTSPNCPNTGSTFGIYTEQGTFTANTSGDITVDVSSSDNKTPYAIRASSPVLTKVGKLTCKYNATGADFANAFTSPSQFAYNKGVVGGIPTTEIRSGYTSVNTATIINGTNNFGKSTGQYFGYDSFDLSASNIGIPFSSWQSTEGSFLDATSSNTTFTMPNEDVTITAQYNAFSVQPSFTRTDDDKGTVSFTLNALSTASPRLVTSTGTETEVVGGKYFSSSELSISEDIRDGTDIYAVPAGDYRVAAKIGEIWHFSNVFTVKYAAKKSVTVNSGTGGGEYALDATVSITADTPASGMEFYRWTTEDGVVFANANSATTTFAMPAKDVTVTATYIPEGTLVGTVEITGETKFGETLTATVKDANATNFTYSWMRGSGGIVVGTNSATYQPDASDITHHIYCGVTATGKTNPITGFTLTPIRKAEGPAAPTGLGSTAETVAGMENGTITGVQIGQEYALADGGEWKDVIGETVGSLPAGDYEVRVKETPTHKSGYVATITIDPGVPATTYVVTVIDGTGGGNFTEGATVSITASAPATGKVFDKWIATGLSDSNELESNPLILIMPANAVTVTATYKDAPTTTYAVTVNSGTGGGNFTEGATVSITASAPATGKVFDKWIATGLSDSYELESNPLTLIMPANAVTVTATYKDAPTTTYAVTVNSGTGGGNFTEGATVSITAGAPATGKVFDKWTTSDGVTFENLNSPTTTFTMPAKAVTVTATYKDATVASIVVNSTSHETAYKVGETLDVTNLTIKATMSDATQPTINVTAGMVAGFNSSAVAASQTLTITYEGKTTSYVISIAKADGPIAPTGIAGVKPTSLGGSDGKITGTTNLMEYASDSSFTSPANCTVTETTGLSAGTYYVRVKATATHMAGAYATVTVPAGSAATVDSIVVNSTSHETAYKVGETLDVTNLTIKATMSDATQPTINVTAGMVAGFNSSAVAASQTLTITYEGKTTSYVISIAKADGPIAPAGIAGVKPTSLGGSDGKITGTTNLMEYASNSSFTSPTDCTGTETTGLSAGTYYVRVKTTTTHEAGTSATVTVPAGSAATYTVTIVSGGSGATGAGSYAKEATVNINAGSRSSYTFAGWTSSDVTITNASNINASFAMPEKAVTVTANWSYSGGGSSIIQPTIPAANGTIQVNYTATGSTAVLALPSSKVDELIAKSKDGEVDIDLSKVSGVTSAELTKTAVTAINVAGLDVTVKLPAGSITLNEDATGSIVGQAEGGSLKLELKQVAKGSLTDVQKQAVKSNDMVLDINISSGTKKISSFDGTLSITVPYSGPQPVAVWYLNDKGELEKLSCTFVDGTVSFDLDHLSLYVVGQDTAWVNPFADVKESDWFYISVEYAFENGLMVGTSDANFSPYTNTTRGMIVTMLHRLEGTPKSDTANAFTDVGSDKYYTNAVAWASDNTIVSGYGNGMFGPEDAITREQMAVILMNYAKYKGYDVSLRADLSKFEDGESISPWAKDAMSWANAEGLIQGSGSQLMPADNALRCQVAAILQRFIETIAK